MNNKSMDYILRRALGSEIRNARERCGMTQKELAQALGVTRTTVINFEYGYTKIKQTVFKTICDCLGISENVYVKVIFER